MALTDIWEMYCRRDNSRGVNSTTSKTGRIHFKSKISGMEYESDWRTHRKSSAFTAKVIRSATSFMPWSCKIPIGDGFHEFL
ncbi:hypothetical protein Ddye_031562 [Dipteronia dyeriana]|uniref:Uncharacterized protein n=1 Tax=Dipteronia dyeriana TaxID=168575 RepID=A0AAD9TIJ6_9ROSI|nr:hypothetical protein Ddye_031562 [Dipteronia dyeriana]